MAGEKFIALEETSQEIKTTVNDVKTNVDGLKNTDVPGIDETVNATYEKTLELERKIGGTGGSFFIYSDMSVKNEQSQKNLCNFSEYTSDYLYTAFATENDVHILRTSVGSNTFVLNIRIYKISNYKTNPVTTSGMYTSAFNNGSGVAYTVCNNGKDAFYILTGAGELIKVDVTNGTFEVICDTKLSGAKYALAINEEETQICFLCSRLLVYDISSEVQIASVSVSSGTYSYSKIPIWFEDGCVKAILSASSYADALILDINKNFSSTERISSVAINSTYTRQTKNYIYFSYYSSNTSKRITVMNKNTNELYELEKELSFYSENLSVLLEENEKIFYFCNNRIYTANAYAPGEICLYLKEGNKVYTDGYVRDKDFVNAPNVDEVVTIPKDSKYLIHNYSYITVG